ncbi:MAG: hypothetical protein V4773_12410, partial [Verrucomicrobiota bacterium]
STSSSAGTGIGTRSSVTQIEQIFMRAQVFNAFCRRHRLPTISPWRNSRLYLHALGRLLPTRLFEACATRFRALAERLG